MKYLIIQLAGRHIGKREKETISSPFYIRHRSRYYICIKL